MKLTKSKLMEVIKDVILKEIRQLTNSQKIALGEDIVEIIAQDVLKIQTLDLRNSDELDFYDLPVWEIERALREAYQAGYENAMFDYEEDMSRSEPAFVEEQEFITGE